MLVGFMGNILSMANIKLLRTVIDYWSKMAPIKTRAGNPPKADHKITLSGKVTMP